jgi:hypothetical protein
MARFATPTISSLKGRAAEKIGRNGYDMTDGGRIKQIGDAAVQELKNLGIRIRPDMVHKQVKALFTGDASLTSLTNTSASVPTPIQFLQTWLPGFVKIITAARMIDEILGIQTLGSWGDEQIVQGVMEPTATASEYGDFTNIPLASWNPNFDTRSIVRGEMGIQVGILEEERSAAMRVSSAEEKRSAAAIALEQWRNSIGFFGYFNGNNRTYGFLNDPNLPAAVPSQSASGWNAGQMSDVVTDLRLGFQTLRNQSMGNIDPAKIEVTIVIPINVAEMLSAINQYGISAWDWLHQNYPKARVVSAPEMSLGSVPAKPGQFVNIMYMFAEEIPASVDGSTDGGQTFMQLVQTKFITTGVEKRAKGYVEDYSNATAGVLCKRPYAVVRIYGI